MKFRVLLTCFALTALCGFGVAQKTDDVTVNVPHTSATSGKEMYLAYCATCHGKEGKGDGPAASALKVPPADLTTLSKRNKGEFPSARFTNLLNGSSGVSAHGSKEMPVWGPIFMAMEHQHESAVRLRIANLAEYVKSLQQK
ncbi:MAG: cytochrome c [Terriglobia bacterium]|jgi:mono/diheme cytochrome c family protein